MKDFFYDYAKLTCLQVPKILAANLIVPGFAVAIPATPDIQPVVNGH